MAFIRNETAYYNAVQDRIRANARIGWVRDAGREKVNQIEEYVRNRARPGRPDFWSSMLDSIDNRGRLSVRQQEVVEAAMARAQQARETRLAEQAQTSRHVGALKTRITIAATVSFTTHYKTEYGITYVYGLTDGDGNVIVAKTTRPLEWERGQSITCTAYVAEHLIRDGVQQTRINRIK